jgi:hypothetical protein
MEENQKSSFKVALNYALITAALLIVLDLIFYVMDIAPRSEIRFVSWLIYIGGIIWGQKVYRDVHSNGLVSYGKSFSIGFTVGFFAALIVAVYSFVFIKFFDPAVVTQAIEASEQQLIESGNMTDEQVDAALEMTARFTTPFMISIMALIFSTIGITIISLITSIFIKKEVN